MSKVEIGSRDSLGYFPKSYRFLQGRPPFPHYYLIPLGWTEDQIEVSLWNFHADVWVHKGESTPTLCMCNSLLILLTFMSGITRIPS